MIEKLTAAQQKRFPEFIEKWTKIGLCTAPADRSLAESGIRQTYQIAGLQIPKIVWCGSPLANDLTRILSSVVASVGDSVRDSVRASVGDSVVDSVRASVGDSVWDSVVASVRASVRDSVWDSVVASAWASVGASVRASVRDSVWDSVRAVRASVRDSVRDSVVASVWASVRASVRDSVGDSCYGQHDACWLSFYDYFKTACDLEEQTKKLNGLWTISKSAGWFLPHTLICWVSERHNILRRDEIGRLHCENGPALAYPDGWSIYASHGVRLPWWVIEDPKQITVEKIDREPNQEIRRVMLEKFGKEKFIRESGAVVLNQDDFGTLFARKTKGGELLKFVEVINSTPEPDGSFRNYTLRVPPEMKTARQAVAWTFQKEENQYSPALQT